MPTRARTRLKARADQQVKPRSAVRSVEWRVVRDLPEICESCRREVQALERVIVLLTRDAKRVAAVKFRESVGGVYSMGCAPENYREEAVGDVPNRG